MVLYCKQSNCDDSHSQWVGGLGVTGFRIHLLHFCLKCRPKDSREKSALICNAAFMSWNECRKYLLCGWRFDWWLLLCNVRGYLLIELYFFLFFVGIGLIGIVLAAAGRHDNIDWALILDNSDVIANTNGYSLNLEASHHHYPHYHLIKLKYCKIVFFKILGFIS